jgi:hypothetical protein
VLAHEHRLYTHHSDRKQPWHRTPQYGATRHGTPCGRRHTDVLTIRLAKTGGSRQTCRSPATNDGVSEGTRTPDTQDHNGVAELQPFLRVDEVSLARVLAELRLKGCDDQADVILGPPVASRMWSRHLGVIGVSYDWPVPPMSLSGPRSLPMVKSVGGTA